jgi:ABC-type uncharacterized transport system auxiliary subunit
MAAALSLAISLVLLAVLLPACGLSRPYPSIRVFSLETDGTPAPAPPKARSARLIQVVSGGAAVQFETRKLVHKIGPNEYTEDFYNELVGLPSRLVADATARWLDSASAAHNFASLLGAGRIPDYTLEIYLTAFDGNFHLSPPRAEAEARITLTEQRRGRTVFSKTYRGESLLDPNAPDRPAHLAEGLGLALEPIFRDLLADIESAISGSRRGGN